MRCVVIGGGVFGLTGALELRRRGYAVVLLDAGPIPNPLAASTDISKVIRLEYGPDEAYMAAMERARDGWVRWNDMWRVDGRDALYHETGVIMACRAPMEPGGFELESVQRLEARGHAPERLDAESLAARFPAWSTRNHVDGFYHAKGGYAESGRVIAALAEDGRRAGIDVRERTEATGFIEHADRIAGVRTSTDDIPADHVVLATGAWLRSLRPDLSDCVRATGHPVFHLQPKDPALFRAERFPTYTADVSRTGYYGFPLNADGVVKIGNHGVGVPVDADAPREVPAAELDRLRAFLADTFPALVDADVVYTRLCLYADTQDEDFWIARDTEREGLTVAGGGSGHGFKFAPVLGEWIADAVDGLPNSALAKFRWRPELRLDTGREAARHHGPADE